MTETTLTIRLSDEVAAELQRIAQEEGVTSEQVVASMAVRQVKAIRSAKEFFAERAKNADGDAFDRVFGSKRQGGEPPRPGDEVE